MLVHAKNPDGILYLEGYTFYGVNMGYEPEEVSYAFYSKYKDALTDATYREGHLSKMFGKAFPMIAFKYSEMIYLPHKSLNKIGHLIDKRYRRRWDHQHKIICIKNAIRSYEP